MNVQTFYATIGGKYEEAMARLMNEQRIYKYLQKLPQTNDMAEMNAAFAEQRWEEAFRFSHNVKGIALNLSLTSLADTASQLCDLVRKGAPTEDFSGLLTEVNIKYNQILDALKILEI